MYQVLLVIHVIVTLALIAVILVQRSADDGLSGLGGGGGGGGFMTSRAQANLLTRCTAILAIVFIANSLALSWLTQKDLRDKILSDKIVEQQIEDDAVLSVPVPESDNVPEATIDAAKEAVKKADDKINETTPEVPLAK